MMVYDVEIEVEMNPFLPQVVFIHGVCFITAIQAKHNTQTKAIDMTSTI